MDLGRCIDLAIGRRDVVFGVGERYHRTMQLGHTGEVWEHFCL